MVTVQLPDMRFRSIRDVPIALLYDMGKRVLLLDLDNTCALRKSECLSDEAIAKINEAKEAGMKVVFVSNTVTGGCRDERVRNIAVKSGAHYHCARFPYTKPHPKPYEDALHKVNCLPSEAVMVGDQLFTDVKGAKRLGMMAILVDPLGSDHWSTRHRRWRQNRVLRKHDYTK